MKKCAVYIIGVGALLLAGCSQIEDDLSGCPVSETSESSYPVSYISLRLTSAADNNSTRAAYETGQLYEYEVNDIIAFLYLASDNGTDVTLSGSGDPAVTPIYFAKEDLDTSKSGEDSSDDDIDYICATKETSANISTDKYNVLAVVNPSSAFLSYFKNGDSFKEDITLDKLRSFIYSSGTYNGAWTETETTPKAYSNFVMSSESETSESVIDLNNPSSDGVATAEIRVERMAARVDYRLDNTALTDGKFTIASGTYANAEVEITGAAMINSLNSGSYLFRHEGENEETGTPLPSLSGTYVIDPWTTGKNGAAISSIYNGTIAIGYDNYYSGEPTTEQKEPYYWANLITDAASSQATIGDYTRLGYTMENTTFKGNTSKLYSTGVVFKAKFTPADGMVVGTYTAGNTFFKYNNVLYATLEDLMSAAWGSENTSFFLTSDNYSSLTWEELENKLGEMPDDPIGYKSYLLDLCDTNTSTDDITGSISLRDYMGSELGYTYASGSYSITGSALGNNSTYSLLLAASNEQVVTYEDATCYYDWWIRHGDNDSNLTNDVMEYCIVRNNIYKLEVSSVSTLGGAIPTEGLLVNASVEPWRLLYKETMNM